MMNFGITNELSPFKDIPECRVGLSPMGVLELAQSGARVYIESQAGEDAGFSDLDYQTAGGTVVNSKEEVYRQSDIVLKVRCPQPAEYSLIKQGQVIMGFIHLPTAPKEFSRVVQEKGITLVGYDIIRKSDGRLPIVIPMSEIAGKLAVQIAGRLLESPGFGSGILLGGIPGVPPAEVVVLGAGTLGNNAALSFASVGANVYVVDIDREKLENLPAYISGMKITTLFSTRYHIEKLVSFANVLIGAAAVPHDRPPLLVTREMAASMRKGSVIIDFSIDRGGCMETSMVSPEKGFIYTEEGVIHFCMPNSTSLAARTATHALTSGLLPYLNCIVKVGFDKVLHGVIDMVRGIYAEKGKIRNEFLK
jgi:alanine dehydrogenase